MSEAALPRVRHAIVTARCVRTRAKAVRAVDGLRARGCRLWAM